jgi:hypothetical protein
MITANVDLSRLMRKMKAAPAAIHDELQKKFRDEARLLVSSSGKVPGLIQVTAPSQGKSNIEANKRGEAKVASDVRKAYGTASDLWRLIKDKEGKGVADNFWAYMKLKRWHQANEIAIRITGKYLDVFDAGREHARRRNPRTGRVIGGEQPRHKNHFLAPTQDKALDSYIKKKQRNVGMLASALYHAASPKLGKINGVPGWILRHKAPWGSCHEIIGTNKYFVIIGLTDRITKDTGRQFGYVLKYRYAAIERQIPYIKRAALKRAQLTIS